VSEAGPSVSICINLVSGVVGDDVSIQVMSTGGSATGRYQCVP
jgi:hypothetical protein